jgi:hypothetical protein
MPYAADGSPHHSLSRVRMHEEKSAKPKAEESAPKKPPMAAEDSGEDIKSVVAQHGPAKEMHYHHDEATNKHHVHSKHGEKEHKSEHDSPEEAADTMKTAMGQDEQESPDEEMGEEAGEAMPEMQSASHHIPGL